MSLCVQAMQAYMTPIAAESLYSSCYLVKLYQAGGYLNSKTLASTDCLNTYCKIVITGLTTVFAQLPSCTLHDTAKGIDFALYQIGNICTGTALTPVATVPPSSSTASPSSHTSSHSSSSSSSSAFKSYTLAPSPTYKSTTSSSSDSGNTTTIIVIVVVVVVVILIAIAIFCYCRRRSNREAAAADAAAVYVPSSTPYEPHTATASSNNTTGTAYKYQASTASGAYSYQPPPETNSVHVYEPAPAVHVYNPEEAAKAMSNTSGTKTGGSTTSVQSDTGLDMCNLDMYRIPSNEVSMIKALAQGAYGEVWLGQYEGQMVAVKKLLNHKRDKNELQKFIQEIALMAKMECPYIVKFIGATWSRPSDIMLVTEYMDGGDLRNLLQSNATTGAFTWSHKVNCAMQIAEALVYLHSLEPKVIHRDLKSRNVLLNSKMQSKLTDFGVSRETDDATMTAGIGTYRWMAPEVLQDGHYTESADMFSFGVILAELSNEIVPYSDLRNTSGNAYTDTAIMAKVMQGQLRPTFAAITPSWFVELGNQCLSLTPEDRPTAMQASYLIKTQLRQKM